jgi:hypothetical protein
MIKLITDFFEKIEMRKREGNLLSKQYHEMYKVMRVVAVFKFHVTWTSHGKVAFNQDISYILKENGDGKRTCEIVNGASPYGRKDYGKEQQPYVSVVKPWLEGLDFEFIPNADSVRTGKVAPYYH